MIETPEQNAVRRFSPSRVARKLSLIVFILGLLWTIFYIAENWRGQRAWKKYKTDLEAKGGRLEFAVFIPKSIPDEQNFAATPFFKNLFPRPPMTFDSSAWCSNTTSAELMITYTNQTKGERHLTDLAAWEKAFAAAQSGKTSDDGVEFQSASRDAAIRTKAASAVLAGLSECEPVFTELRAASARPDARHLIHYDLEFPATTLLPHLTQIKDVVRRLQLKACAELADDRLDAALADVKLMIRLTDSIQEEPFLISWLVRLACFHISIHPVWEGLAEHRWTETELRELQGWLQSLNFLAELNKTLDGGRSFNLQNIEAMAAGKYRLSDFLNIGWCGNTSVTSLQEAAIRFFLPCRGWFAWEKINVCQMYELNLKTAFDVEEKRVFRQRIKSSRLDYDLWFEGQEFSFKDVLQHSVFSNLLFSSSRTVSVRAVSAQIAADQALIACALERFRIAHGELPKELETLAPKFISKVPHDVLSGEPYHYRLTHKDDFILYSVGWNGKDDNGTPGKTLWNDENGDWVWRYPIQQ